MTSPFVHFCNTKPAPAFGSHCSFFSRYSSIREALGNIKRYNVLETF